jgi:hypothetical protein
VSDLCKGAVSAKAHTNGFAAFGVGAEFANYGRFGPYIQYGKKYVSLKEITPEEVTLNEALTLIKAKEKFDAERIIKTFTVLNL